VNATRLLSSLATLGVAIASWGLVFAAAGPDTSPTPATLDVPPGTTASPAPSPGTTPGPTPVEALPDLASANQPPGIDVRAGAPAAAILRAQVLLDRAHFSVGEIDAKYGANTKKAIAGFQVARDLPPSGEVDVTTWGALEADQAPVLVSYVISAEDVAGPFYAIPHDMMEKATLPALTYSSPLEALAEKFHASPHLLTALNPGAAFDRVGQEILVPNVASSPPAPAARVVVDGSARAVQALDADERTLARYPATIGSARDPLPIGKWKINGRAWNPPFHYNPELFWDADPDHARARIPPGPNNPVGVVWIDLSREHYGIHGTPEPSQIGRSQSHGCIRLTNWNAAELAQIVEPGTPIHLRR
jgi:lipoprotein-anchoring transpeptidase ErfK/SrfK